MRALVLVPFGESEGAEGFRRLQCIRLKTAGGGQQTLVGLRGMGGACADQIVHEFSLTLTLRACIVLAGHPSPYRFVMTGSYQNMFHVIDRNNGSSVSIEARTQRPKTLMPGRGPAAMAAVNVDNIDYNWKVLHSAFHPRVCWWLCSLRCLPHSPMRNRKRRPIRERQALACGLGPAQPRETHHWRSARLILVVFDQRNEFKAFPL